MPKDNAAATISGFESDLWRAADALRSNMDAAESKHVALPMALLRRS
jgi:type I restriction enzyme M protein